MVLRPAVSRRPLAAAFVSIALLSAPTAFGAVVTFALDLPGFVAAAGQDSVTVDFDDVADGTDVGGQTFAGATFDATGSPLIVVDASTTATSGAYVEPFDATNKLTATSGANVLSPGGAALGPGPDAAVENDDLTIVFDEPVGFVGFDHLSQRADGQAFTRVQVISTSGETLFDGVGEISNLPAGPEGIQPGGADFWGVVSDANDIKTIVFNEVDEDANAADNNIGYDSFRFGTLAGEPPPVGIPLPAAVYAGPALLGLAELVRRRVRYGH